SSSGFGTIQLQKPGAKPGDPDLAVTKIGPATANAGQTITYTLNYTNDISGTTATGAELIDNLPTLVNFVSCSGGCSILGNTITWDLGDLPRGASGSVSYEVTVANSAQSGQTFHNSALLVSAEADVNFADNTASVTP